MPRCRIAGLLALLLITPAWGQSVLQPPAQRLTQAETAELQRFAAEPDAAGASLVRVDVETLKNAAAGKELTFTLEPGRTLAIRSREVRQLEDHNVLWIGEIAAKNQPAGQALIVMNGDKVTGTIDVPDGALYELAPASGGMTALIEVNRRWMPTGNDEVRDASRRAKVAPPGPRAATPRDGGPVIPVLFLYTPTAGKTIFGINELIDLVVADGNEAFRNSQLDIKFSVAGRVQINYDESGRDFDRIIKDLSAREDVTKLRAATYASFVVLFVDNWVECGRGTVLATPERGYAVLSTICAAAFHDFAHEAGHNAGAIHDVEHDPGDWPFSFGHGYQDAEHGWKTIMAYPCELPRVCVRTAPNYSNPDVKFEGSPTGTTDTENVAKVWQLRARDMESFRSSERWKKVASNVFSDISCDQRESQFACFGVTSANWLFKLSVEGKHTVFSPWDMKAISSAPVCLISADRTDCLAADSAGALIDGTQIGSGRVVWTSLGRKIVGAPACVRSRETNIDCFVRQPDGSVAHIARRGNAWGGKWDELGGTVTSGLSCTYGAANPFDCFARGTNVAMWQLAWNGVNGGWQDRGEKINSRPECLSWASNRVDCFALGGQGELLHIAADKNNWAKWHDLGGEFAGDIGCTSRAEGRLDCFVAGKRPGIQHIGWNGTNWTGWEELGGSPASPPKCVAPKSDRIDCFIRGTDNALYHKYWDGNAWYPQTADEANDP